MTNYPFTGQLGETSKLCKVNKSFILTYTGGQILNKINREAILAQVFSLQGVDESATYYRTLFISISPNKTCFRPWYNHKLPVRPCSADSLNSGFFTSLFGAVGRSKIKSKIKS